MGLGKTYSADYLIDSNGNTGVSGQVLISTATGIDWADGSAITGGPYLPLAGGTMSGNLILNDNVELRLGTSSDFKAGHTGSYTYMYNYTGHMYLRNFADNSDIIFQTDDGSGGYASYLQLDGSTGAVVLNHYGSTKLSTTSTGVEVTGKITNLTAGTGNLDAVNVQQLNDATTGTLIYKGTWSAAPTTTSVLDGAVSSAGTIVIDAVNPGISVGATITGTGISGTVTVSNIAADGITIAISSAQTIADGVTLTFTTVGGTPDLSQTARKVTGDYYICETAGVATPNGASTTPDEWAVGDWVAFSDLATDAWQKIDNSSVLSGAGTGGTVPIWAGSGTSVTLADAPITVSGSDTTFAGIVNATNIITINSVATGNPYLDFKQGGTQKAYIQYSDTGDNLVLQSDGQMSFKTSGNTDALTIDTSQNATFAGDITATANYSAGNSKIIYKAQRSGGAVAGDWSYDDATTDMSLGTSTAHSFSLKTGNTRALTLDTSQNATFAGDVTLSSGALSITGDGSNAATLTESSAGIFTIAAVDDIRLDATGDISLDAGGDDIRLKVSGTEYAKFNNSSSNLNIFSSIQDKAIKFIGNDNGTEITALTLNMADGGDATFAGDVTVGALTSGATAQLVINHEGGSGAVAKFMSRTNRAFIQVGDNDTNGYIVAEGDLLSIGRAASASSNNININASNNVGIGTTNPTATLNVKNSSAIALPATSGTTQSASALRVDNGNVVLDFGSYSSNGASWIQSSLVSNLATTFPISLNPNGGNVGIGTASPSESLEILKDGGAIIRLHDPGNNSWKIKADSDFHIYDDSNSDYLTILNNGNVGIGTTGPTAALHVEKAISGGFAGTIYNTQATGGFGLSVRGGNSSSQDALRVQNVGGTYLLNVKGDGNVGIGTTDPASKLHLSTTGSSTLTIQNTTNSGNATLNFRDEGNNDQYSIYYALGANRAYNLVNGNGLTVYSSQTSGEIARFGMGTGYTDSYFTGNVGINTTSPELSWM